MSTEKEKKENACADDCNCKNDVNEQASECQSGEDCACAEKATEAQPEASKEKTVEEQLAESQDKYLRLVAEFDNYRKRTARERLEMIMTASEETIKGLLNIIDDFERAIKAAETTTDVNSLREGTQLILQKMLDYLTSKGVQAIETPVGTEFDTDVHDAVTKFPATDAAHKNKVIDTVQKGYKLNDKVIRYAKVVVGE